MNLKPKFFEKKEPSSYRISFEEQNAPLYIGQNLVKLLPTSLKKPIIIACIGTDRSTGDALGPLIGSLLQEKQIPHFHVYGTLENPIHAVNLEDQMNEIKKMHIHPFIIGIDACLGRLKSVGDITINEGALKPGAGVNKQLPPVGEVHLTGVVNVSGFMEFFVLQNTRLNLVMKMARTIADGIVEADKLLQLQKIETIYKRPLLF
ncbi:spore protease YyaC [Calidifontibacillus oryziterrae]|uniref:spore protease YyaC n=1 Tax=Calidifontibacillus oryziterrae TaxID=1191699 RepID=UPI0002DF8874|nr:spore protease YyaC [Calidifontibacillus oryziterrae]